MNLPAIRQVGRNVVKRHTRLTIGQAFKQLEAVMGFLMYSAGLINRIPRGSASGVASRFKTFRTKNQDKKIVLSLDSYSPNSYWDGLVSDASMALPRGSSFLKILSRYDVKEAEFFIKELEEQITSFDKESKRHKRMYRYIRYFIFICTGLSTVLAGIAIESGAAQKYLNIALW